MAASARRAGAADDLSGGAAASILSRTLSAGTRFVSSVRPSGLAALPTRTRAKPLLFGPVTPMLPLASSVSAILRSGISQQTRTQTRDCTSDKTRSATSFLSGDCFPAISPVARSKHSYAFLGFSGSIRSLVLDFNIPVQQVEGYSTGQTTTIPESTDFHPGSLLSHVKRQ